MRNTRRWCGTAAGTICGMEDRVRESALSYRRHLRRMRTR